HSVSQENNEMANLTQLIERRFKTTSYKRRFAINTNQGIYFVETENIIYFVADEGVVFAHDTNNKRHLLSESTLKEIEAQLDPLSFFRINRSELINKPYIVKIE